jgi:uncharacterized protein
MTPVSGEWYAERPRPLADHVSRIFWDGLREGELRYQGCTECGTVQFYPRAICTGCGVEPEWRVASGRGTVHTFTVIRQHGTPPFKEQTPYVVAMIDVEPGFRIMGNVVDVAPDDVEIGLPVRVRFTEVDEDLTLPVWAPADDAEAD